MNHLLRSRWSTRPHKCAVCWRRSTDTLCDVHMAMLPSGLRPKPGDRQSLQWQRRVMAWFRSINKE